MFENYELFNVSINCEKPDESTVIFKCALAGKTCFIAISIVESEIPNMIKIAEEKLNKFLTYLGYYVSLLDHYDVRKSQAMYIKSISIDPIYHSRVVDIAFRNDGLITTVELNLPIKYSESTDLAEIRDEAIFATKMLIDQFHSQKSN